MDRYLICSDIDGTLMTCQQEITENTLGIIKELQNQGHIFYLATGRMLLSAKQIASTISKNTGVIASNGGVLSFENQLIKHVLDIESSLFIYRLAMEYHLPLFFFSHDTVYYSLVLPDYFKDETDQGRINTGHQKAYHHLKDDEDLKKYAADFINAIIISEDYLEDLKIVKGLLCEDKQLTITSSFYNNIEISPKGISKAIAIKELQARYQIPMEHTISFGDGGNDIEMFNVSGMSVAMENASKEVKMKCNHQTSSNNDEGVYQFLKEYFQIGGK